MGGGGPIIKRDLYTCFSTAINVLIGSPLMIIVATKLPPPALYIHSLHRPTGYQNAELVNQFGDDS